jgi:hypothetical protein
MMWPSSLTTTPLPYSTPFAGSANAAGFSGNGEGRHRRAQRLHDGFYRHVVDQAEAAKLAFPDRSTNIKISQTRVPPSTKLSSFSG